MFIFVFKQKTAYEMRISDWSSDVCSSDLPRIGRGLTRSPFASKTGRGGLAMSEILIDDEEGVRTITLNRPDRLNALTGSIMTPLADACADAARDSSVGCVIVTGAGRDRKSVG